MKVRVITSLVCLAILCGGNGFCKTIQVPGEYSLIQSAISAAVNGDTVLVADGTYRGPGNSNLDLMGKAIILESENGAENCIIDGQGTSRAFHVKNNEAAGTVINGFTITNGHAGIGGGIYCEGASPTIINCKIIGNKAEFGGGGMAFAASASPAITDCTITGNISRFGGGGGIIVRESNPAVTTCGITGNSGDQGGGIFCQKASPIINRCRIQSNTAELGGGGIFCETGSSPTIVNTLINSNKTGFGGGGIYCRNGSSPTLLHCTITGNKAEPWNSVSWGGGILCDKASFPSVTNTILWANTPTQLISIASSRPAVTYSDVQGGFSGTGNLDVDPLFVAADDYRLNELSPCIDTGNPPSNTLPGNAYAASDYSGITRPRGTGYDMVCECICTDSITISSGVKVERGATLIIKAPKVNMKSLFLAEDGSDVRISRP